MPNAIQIHPRADPAASVEAVVAVSAVSAERSAPGAYGMVLADGHGSMLGG